jgi:hypothetical protein
VDTEPTDDELRAFIGAMLSNLNKALREPEVLDEAIRDHRDMWVMLYRANLDADALDPPS